MKKLLFTLALCFFAGASFAQIMFPAEGKIMEYSATVTSPMGDQKMDIKQYVKSREGDKIVLTTETALHTFDIKYTLSGDKVTIPLKELMSSSLGQMGNFEVLESSGDITYPMDFEPGKTYDGGTMKIKATVQGMEVTMNLSMENRQAVGKESITVPAGTFECIKVTEEMVIQVMGQDQVSEMTSWYAPGTGLVKQFTSSMNGMVTNTMELTKITDK